MKVVSVYFLSWRVSLGWGSLVVVFLRSVLRGGSLDYLRSVWENMLPVTVMFMGFSLSILEREGRFLIFLSIWIIYKNIVIQIKTITSQHIINHKKLDIDLIHPCTRTGLGFYAPSSWNSTPPASATSSCKISLASHNLRSRLTSFSSSSATATTSTSYRSALLASAMTESPPLFVAFLAFSCTDIGTCGRFMIEYCCFLKC